MGLIGGAIKGAWELRKAKAIAKMQHETQLQMAQIKAQSVTDAARIRKGGSSQSDINQLREHMESIQSSLQHHSDLLHDILNALLH